MARRIGQLGGLPGGIPRSRLMVWAGAGGLVGVTGIVSGLGYGLAAAGLVVAVISCLIAIWNWRFMLLALVMLVPYTGIPSILLYPDVGPAALLKDVFLVLPLYVGLAVAALSGREPARAIGASVMPLVLFGLWVLAQSLNPLLPSPLVALVGLRVWLFYVPLAFATAYLVKTRVNLQTLLTLFTAAGAVPAVVGVIQAFLVASGHQDIAYAVYGAAAAAVTQGFAQFQLEGGGVIARIPSTFSFAGQYAAFTLTYVVATYARWRLAGRSNSARRLSGAAFFFAILAAVTSGSRGAFLLVPGIMLLALAFERRISFARVVVALLAAASFTAVLSAIGLSIPSLAQLITDTAVNEFEFLVVQGFGTATQITTFGLGTGSDTGATRYVLSGGDLFAATGGQWYESWYVKIWLELGVIGLVLAGAVAWTIGRASARALRAAPDEGVRATVAVISAFLLVSLIYNMKGPYMDIDPVNVLLWVFVGLLFAIAGGLDQRVRAGAARAPDARI